MFNKKSNLKLTFEVGTIDNRSMSLTINNQGHISLYSNLSEGIFVYQDQIEFPCDFKIIVDGKGPLDTQVDEQGNILQDKYIKLTNIEIDRLACDPYYLYKNIVLNTKDGQQITSNYWGFNGTIDLDFNQANSFYWGLSCA